MLVPDLPLFNLGVKAMKVETLYPDADQLSTMQSLVYAEAENATFWSPHLSDEIIPFIDYHSIKIPAVVSNYCKYAVAYFAENDQDRALLLLAALRVLDYLNDLKLVTTRALFTIYDGNIPATKALDKLLDEEAIKVLRSPIHWSV